MVKKNIKGYYMVKWCKICRFKKKGGLGVLDLRKQNISLLCKWWWKLDTQQGLWQDIVKAKYLRNKIVASVQSRFNDSPCWKALLSMKDTYMAGRKVGVGNGDICRLWKDHFIGTSPLCEQFPVLFDLCQSQDISLKDALDLNLAIPFRRILCGQNLEAWNNIKTKLLELNLSTTSDSIHWSLNQNRIFSTKSVYIWLEKPSRLSQQMDLES
jgi:hypothetical protein